jgi:phosphoribosylformylglycinamidine synthase
MSQCAVDEAVRNVVVAGGDPDTCCLLDNFCWPDPVQSAKNPEGSYRLGQLVRACQGLYDICTAYGMPLVSGKDSMKNDFKGKDKRGQDIMIGVLPTLLVTSLAKVKMGTAPGSHFREAGDLIYVLGGAGDGLGGSEYAYTYDVNDSTPKIDMARNMGLYRKLHKELPLVSSAHDISEGGFLVAVAEAMIGGGCGVQLFDDLDAVTAFNEAPGRIVVSVAPAKKTAFENIFDVLPVGTVTDTKQLSFGKTSILLASLSSAWKKGF